jgi:trehalose 6-phosphate phosphatase
MKELFTDWLRVTERLAKADGLLLMLDFDGTLSPIVESPEDATIPAETKAGLEALAVLPDVTVAIVSGRTVTDVRERVGLSGLIYIGNHGRERLDPGTTEPVATTCIPESWDELRAALVETFAPIPNARIDDKGSTIAVHHRRVADKRKGEMKWRAYDLAERFEGTVHFTEGKKVFDYFPVDAASKGSAACTLLAQQGGIDAVLSMYCGDDITDEPAFEALPPHTITVYVGLTPGKTAARYRVDDPSAIAEMLERLLVARRAGQSEEDAPATV